MKYLKKFASLALALVMVLALAAPAFATEVTIKLPPRTDDVNPDTTETYKAYKVFDAQLGTETPNAEGSTFDHVAYSIRGDSPFFNTVNGFAGIKLTEIGTENGVKIYDVAVNNNFSAAGLADALQTVVKNATPPIAPAATGDDDTATLDTPATLNLADVGYYLIVGSLGSKAILDTVGQETMTITTKNKLPTIEKEPVTLPNGVGDSIEYKVTIHAKPGAEGYVLHDKMSTGLQFNNNVVVKVGEEVVPEANYTVITDSAVLEENEEDRCTFHVVFKETYLGTITGDTDIVVSYSATVTAEAVVLDKVKNEAHLEYGNENKTTTEKPDVETPLYQFDLVKTNSNELGKKVLENAKFELYREAEGGEAMKLVYVADGNYYRPSTKEDDPADITTTIIAGFVTIKGLGADEYYLEETEAPATYNIVVGRQIVTVGPNINLTATVTPATDNAPATYVEGGVRVINLAGTELPSTGGIGTTIFYVVGGVLLVGAVVVLIAKRRTSADE